MARRPSVFVLPLIVFAVSSPVRAEGDPDIGRKLAQDHCSRCHVVGDFNPMGGIGSTPSFQLIVNALKDYRDRFSTFYARRPHGAVITVEGIGRPTDLPENASPIRITADDVDHIVAFVETLRK